MHHWSAKSTYYHIMIDRFATDKNYFEPTNAQQDARKLHRWMGGNLHGITQSLDYLQYLGIGAILLTPFFKGKKYHGYWTTDFENIDPHFGNSNQLQKLISKAHQCNIRVIMDLPITHCHRDFGKAKHAFLNKNSPYRNWFYFKENQDFLGFFDDSNLPEFNLELPELRKYLKKVTDRWLSFGFDGIRFDHAKRPSVLFWNDFTSHLRRENPQLFLLGENWHESGKIGTLAPYLHGELNIPLCKALRQFAKQPCLHTIKQVMQQIREQKSLRQKGYLLPSFLDNHDMERISLLAQDNQPTIALSYLLQLTLPYPPVVYYGSERGQTQANNLANGHYERDRFFREPMNWHNGKDMLGHVSNLIQYRNKYIEWFMSEPVSMSLLNGDVLTYSYLIEDTVVTVYINFGPAQQQIELPSSPTSMLLGCNNRINHYSDNKVTLNIEGYSGAIINRRHNRATIELPLRQNHHPS